jgi:Na+-driven multidrug efflux pump
MAIKEGFRRVEKIFNWTLILCAVGGIILVILASVYDQTIGSSTEEDIQGLLAWFLFLLLLRAFVWLITWIIQGFLDKEKD